MPGSSSPRCRNGHPILTDCAACRTCGAPLTADPATTPATGDQLQATGQVGHATANREVLAMLKTILAALILMALGLLIVMVRGLG